MFLPLHVALELRDKIGLNLDNFSEVVLKLKPSAPFPSLLFTHKIDKKKSLKIWWNLYELILSLKEQGRKALT